MFVVADASVLIHLSRIRCFHLLRSLYGDVRICPSVYVEVVERGWGLPGSVETEEAMREGWVRVIEVVDKRRAGETAREHNLGMANAETVQLAREVKPDLVLAYEEEVRNLAQEYDLRIRGCLGVLIEAARKGFISVSEARSGGEELRSSGYRMSNEILKFFYDALESLEER